MNKIYLEYDVRKYFEQIVPLKGKKVVDWGCNHGNMLKYQECDFKYIGLDVDKELILQNKERWPEHTWIHLNVHNHQYNKSGKNEWIDIKADLVLMFSIFTHMTISEMKQYIEKIKSPLLSTFIPSDNEAMLRRALNYRLKERPDIFDKVYNKEYAYIVGTPEDVIVYTGFEEIPKMNNVWYFLVSHHTDFMKQFGDIIKTNYESGIESTQNCLYIK
jgi:hypothetical protein